MADKDGGTLCAVWDIGPRRDDPEYPYWEPIFASSASVTQGADIAFCQLERSSEWNLYWYEMEQDTLYRFPKDCKKEMIAKAVISKRSLERVSFLPVFINDQAQPEALNQDDDRFRELLEYVEWVSDQFPHSFKAEGNEVVVQSPD